MRAVCMRVGFCAHREALCRSCLCLTLGCTTQDIFKLFFIQLRLLRDNDENFQKRFTLLETLATLKMPLLLVEICRAEDSRDHDDAPLIDMFNTLLEIALYVLPAMLSCSVSCCCLDVCGGLAQAA